MSGLPILDLLIGLIFIYFLLGLICSVIQEIISNIARWRAVTLNNWLEDTFTNQNFSKDILCHKLIDGLTAKGKLAAYIPADKFSQVVFDLIHKQQHSDKPYTLNTLRESITTTTLIHDDLKRMLLQSISEASGDIEKVRSDFEGWFNNAMQRVSGTYKKKVQLVILLASLIVTTLINADSIELARYLYANPSVSKSLADHATQVAHDASYVAWISKVKTAKSDSLTQVTLQNAKQSVLQLNANIAEIKKLKSELDNTKLPLGWGKVDNWFSKVLGLLCTALAVSLGAPFWFDMLNKLTNLRSSGNKPPSK